ncbi:MULTISPECIES: hypothetical protein [Nocardia]|uniref:hypothetical protein n=1 Tax=Nocardia TaxID=1817 RepID=UPI001895F3C0|nr:MULTISPECIES: hypothetical protein [Nocardia]MBF6348061.1 hypothetical protein [Nocardia flavorosea]
MYPIAPAEKPGSCVPSGQCAGVAERPMNAEQSRQPKYANDSIDRLLPQQR